MFPACNESVLLAEKPNLSLKKVPLWLHFTETFCAISIWISFLRNKLFLGFKISPICALRFPLAKSLLHQLGIQICRFNRASTIFNTQIRAWNPKLLVDYPTWCWCWSVYITLEWYSYRYRMLSRPYAFNCVLRLRTSSEFQPSHSVRSLLSFLFHRFLFYYLDWLIILALFSTVWAFLPRSAIWKCPTHNLLWFFCYICLRFWICK